MNTEEQMVGIARISHGKVLPHTEQKDARRLINYLMKNNHTSPFEFIELTFRWRLPIFVARQVIRHRTANVNEKSARYAELDAEMYIPAIPRILGQDTKNKQGSAGELDTKVKEWFRKALIELERQSKAFYNLSLGEGIAKELSRISLPVGVYTDWVWKMDLHNLFHFLKLRLDSHAQYEVRVYAEAMANVIREAYPICWDAFEEYVLYSKTLARIDVAAIQAMLTVYKLDYPDKANDPNLSRALKEMGL